MPDWTISGPGLKPTSAHALAAWRAPALAAQTTRRTWILNGTDQPAVAAVADMAFQRGHRVVLTPPPTPPDTTRPAISPPGLLLPAGHTMSLNHTRAASQTGQIPGADIRAGWDLALFSSGSTTGHPRGYGHTRSQLADVTSWYRTIYQATGDSVIVTALPAHYNFTFIAGVLLAARLGARLHLSSAFGEVLTDAARFARTADRVIVLANPVVLDHGVPTPRLPAHVTIDCGGAPLSTTAITDYRAHGADVREGYGLTETASLTHFDTEATTESLGTVGTTMPGVTTTIAHHAGQPIVEIGGPTIAIPLDPAQPHQEWALRTTDLGHIDPHGRLRILGRADDHPIASLWPRDTLDALGPLLGRRCALVLHPTPDHVSIRLLAVISTNTAAALTDRAAELLGLPLDHVAISNHDSTPLLHSAKLPYAPTTAPPPPQPSPRLPTRRRNHGRHRAR